MSKKSARKRFAQENEHGILQYANAVINVAQHSLHSTSFPNNLAVYSSHTVRTTRPNDVPVSLGVTFDQPLVPVLLISYGIVHIRTCLSATYMMPQVLSSIIIVIIHSNYRASTFAYN